ncbi:MAG: outer membrane beta-barrel protein [Xanthobacteraceae bacterium]|nr:outer membrane beta-barrel protein [Xanthobacteraceae bacterium]
MKRNVLVVMALAALSAPAAAADMVLADKVPPVINWTGFYVGGDVAVASTVGNAQSSALPSSVVPFGVAQLSGGVGGASFAGGAFAGYDLQFAPRWVVGVEADWNSMNTNGRLTSTWLDNTGVVVPAGVTTLSAQLQWAATVRGRIGYLIGPRFLAYATGGVAWGKWEYGADSTNSAIGYAANAAFAKTDAGWVAGIGFEWAPFPNYGLMLRAEYLNYRFGGAQATAAGGFPGVQSGYLWSAPDVNVGRAGASYKF